MPEYKREVRWEGYFSRRGRIFNRTPEGVRLDVERTLSGNGYHSSHPDYKGLHDLLVKERDNPDNIAHLEQWVAETAQRMTADARKARERKADKTARMEALQDTEFSKTSYLRSLRGEQ